MTTVYENRIVKTTRELQLLGGIVTALEHLELERIPECKIEEMMKTISDAQSVYYADLERFVGEIRPKQTSDGT